MILKQGVEVWNKWREENPEIQPDLSGADLSSAKLIQANCKNPSFMDTSLGRANLKGSDFTRAILRNTDLRNVDLTPARPDLQTHVPSTLKEADLRGANLAGADFSHADLEGADLRGAFIWEVNLGAAKLSGADLRNADLTASYLLDTDIQGANLGGADLTGVSFHHTILNNANLTQARIKWTTFIDVDLSNTIGLNTTLHEGPSYISIDTIYLSKGNIPERFLRGAGVPENFITFMRSLTGRALDFYSCFISYSSKDQLFADRLYADLQSRGVRCWFAPEDLKIGDKFRQGIEESIRVHDKVLLILSEHSIFSPWVEDEVESALEREHSERRTVLFPVRIDDALITTDQAWAASLRRSRHIGGFTGWKNHDDYQNALDRLLRDLRAETVA